MVSPPEQEHVNRLQDFKTKDFVDWLINGFKDISDDKKSLNAFYPLNYFVGHDDLINELKNIYYLLQPNVKQKFRESIAQGLSNLPPEISSVSTVRGLFHLAGRIKATEVLPVVKQYLENGFFSIKENNSGSELFALTLDVVGGMSSVSEDGKVMRNLVNSNFFKFDYSPMAFISLCQSEPEKFPDHLKLLRKDFAKMHKEKGTNNAYITAKRFVHYVDTKIIADNLYLAKLIPLVNPENFDNDNWLGQAMFIGKNTSLELKCVKDNFFISKPDLSSPTIYRVSISGEHETLRDYLGEILEKKSDISY